MYSIQTEYSIVSNSGVIMFYIESNPVGQDSVVGIVTHYGLDAPGIESWGGRDYPCAYRQALWPAQHPRQWVLGLFPVVKRLGHIVYPTSSNSAVKERVELYLYSSGPSWPAVHWTYRLLRVIHIAVIINEPMTFVLVLYNSSIVATVMSCVQQLRLQFACEVRKTQWTCFMISMLIMSYYFEFKAHTTFRKGFSGRKVLQVHTFWQSVKFITLLARPVVLTRK